MRQLTSIKFDNSPMKTSQGKAEEGGLLPAALGIGGSLLGARAGLGVGAALPVANMSGVPEFAGAVAGGSLGGGLGQGIGQAIQDIVGGKGFDMGRTARQTGEGAAYGAIPGGAEMKGLGMASKFLAPLAEQGIKGIAARTLGRAGTGYLAGNVAQQVANTGSENKQNQFKTGALTGALNALSPALGKVLNIAPQAVGKLGKTAEGSAARILENKAQPELNAIQRLFGKTAISTSGGRSTINPEVQSVIDKHGIQIPPQGDINQFVPSLNKAAASVEQQLQPIFQNPDYSIKTDYIRQIIIDNASVLGSRKNIPADVMRQLGTMGDNSTIGQLKELQRTLGGWANWENPSQPVDKFATKAYKEIGSLIDSKLGNSDLGDYKDLMREHQILAKSRDIVNKLTSGGGTLPEDITSAERAATKSQTGLSGERLIGMGVHAIPYAIGGGAQLLGLPPEAKAAAALGAGLYGLAEFGPHLNPEAALSIGQKMQNVPQVGQGVEKLLQQIGVRLPGLGN